LSDREDNVIHGYHYKTGLPIIITIKEGLISDISYGEASQDNCWIGPGLVDIQVNGYHGIDFNRLPLENRSIVQLSKKLWKEGITTYFPTIITNEEKTTEELLKKISEAIYLNETKGTIGGIHLEGPFISLQNGPRGAHNRSYIQSPNWSIFEKWQLSSDNNIKIVTMSPEWQESASFINKCVGSGIKVAIGHTAANTEQISEAVNLGASLSTHLGNGCHQELPRHPNYIWDQLAEVDLWTSLIGDGFHLPDSVLRVIKAIKENKAFLISDSTELAGMPCGSYKSHIGSDVELTEGRKLHIKNNPNILAGSAMTLKQTVERLYARRVFPFWEIWDMASVIPSSYLGLPTSKGLTIGSPADIVVFKKYQKSINIIKTIKSGDIVFSANYS
jgi:N-acetylglucosamine-6-phosphate deacetylase